LFGILKLYSILQLSHTDANVTAMVKSATKKMASTATVRTIQRLIARTTTALAGRVSAQIVRNTSLGAQLAVISATVR
jgi:hypothetical protein